MKGMFVSAIAGVALAAGLSVSARASELVAQVDVASQTMTVTQSGRLLYTWKVSTARRGYITPKGMWTPTRMHKMWRSRKYDNAPMPYAVFYHGGYAIHGTTAVRRLGTPASHGCVRLLTSNAATFYSLVKQSGADNTRIIVN